MAARIRILSKFVRLRRLELDNPTRSSHAQLLISFIFLWLSNLASGQNIDLLQNQQIDPNMKATDVIIWTPTQAESTPDGITKLAFRLETRQNFSLYTDKVTFIPPVGTTIDSIETPETNEIIDPLTGGEAIVYSGGDFLLTLRSLVPITTSQFTFQIKFLGCTSNICLFPFTQKFQIDNQVRESDPTPELVPVEAEEPYTGSVLSPKPEENLEERLMGVFNNPATSLATLLVILFLAGLLTNLTPCVYPMIPITIRVLGHSKDKSRLAPILYASGIVLTYSILGMFAALSNSMFGGFMASKTFSVVMGLIMFALALNMLGFGNLTKLQAIGSRMGTRQGAWFNPLAMGAGAGLVAAPCTGPILAALLGQIAANQTALSEATLMMFIYALGFGLPYVFLGQAASKARAIKVSPKLLVFTKLLFASVIFALGFYYLRIAFYDVTKAMLHYWPHATAAGLVLGLGLSWLCMLSPNLHAMKKGFLPPMICLGAGIFAGTQWISSTGSIALEANLQWVKTEKEALELARKNQSLILVDAWAEWCEACKKMDATTFADQRVIQKLATEGWVLLKRDLTEGNRQDEAFKNKYGILSLPTLTLLPANGDTKDQKSIAGYVSAAALLKHLDEFAQQQKDP